MLLLGRQLATCGIDHEFWFCQASRRLPEFMETGRATLGPLSVLARRLDGREFDVVQMTASDPAAEVVSMMAAGRSKVLVTARGSLADIWDHANCFAYSAISTGMATVNQPYTDVEIEVVRNSVDVDRFSPRPKQAGGTPIVAFVGRTTDPLKDFPRFTRIARRLAERGARVWVADAHEGGWKDFEGKPVERIDVERWEMVRHAEIPDFYRAVAASGGIVLMTSRSEGFGNVAPEAAACGAWVAAPDVMGLREAVLPGRTGNLFPAAATDDDAAELVNNWMSQPHDSASCAEVARAEFSPTVMMEGYRRIYERTEQRLVTRTPPAADAPELEYLRQDLRRQRQWRAVAAGDAAVEFAASGHRALALGALKRVYIGGTDGRVYSFGASSGKLRWSYDTGGYVYASPALWRERVLIGSYSGSFYALDAATGDVKWRFQANGPISGSATVLRGLVYFATLKQQQTYALDAATGRLVWSFPDGKYSPVVADRQRLYLVGYTRIYGLLPRTPH